MSIFGTYNSFHFDGGNAGPTAGPTGPTGPEGLMNFFVTNQSEHRIKSPTIQIYIC